MISASRALPYNHFRKSLDILYHIIPQQSRSGGWRVAQVALGGCPGGAWRCPKVELGGNVGAVQVALGGLPRWRCMSFFEIEE